LTNGDVTSKTNGVETYTFTYTRELKVETISLNAQVLHRFGYDPNGNRVADKRQDGTLVYYVGGYYEYSVNGTETHTTKYYGSEAIRVDNELRYILSDHLGSTSVVTDGSGNYLAQQRYDAWGLTRYIDGTIPTDKEYTGQRHSRDVGLYDYKARWYDPLLGRFLMEDTIIPNQGVMKLDGYVGMMNNPVRYIDPTGHRVCDDMDEDGNCISYGWNEDTPDVLDTTELSNTSVNCDLSGYCLSGRDLYDFYLAIWPNKKGWWWKTYGEDGYFTILDFIAMLYQIEAFLSLDDEGFLEGYQGFAATHTYEYCKWHSCDGSSPEGMLNFLASYTQSGRNHVKAGAATFNDFDNPGTDPEFALKTVLAIISPESVGHPEWKNGRDNNSAYDFGLVSMGDKERAEELIRNGLVYYHNAFQDQDGNWVVKDNTVLIIGPCESAYFHNDMRTYSIWGCNLNLP
jgi:RHS repeat-associated protein